MIDAPPGWSGSGDLLAVRIPGPQMEPRLFAGEVVIAQRDLPPTKGADCLVEFHDGSVLVKTYVGERNGALICSQYNPAQEVSFDRAAVRAVHAVTWRQ